MRPQAGRGWPPFWGAGPSLPFAEALQSLLSPASLTLRCRCPLLPVALTGRERLNPRWTVAVTVASRRCLSVPGAPRRGKLSGAAPGGSTWAVRVGLRTPGPRVGESAFPDPCPQPGCPSVRLPQLPARPFFTRPPEGAFEHAGLVLSFPFLKLFSGLLLREN